MPFPTSFQITESLFIFGYPPVSGVASLYTGPSQRENEQVTLHITGPASAEAPLFVNTPPPASGEQRLYVWGQEAFGGGPDQLDTTLTIKGMTEGGAPFTSTSTLTVLGPDKIDNDTNTTLFIESGPTPTGSGTLQFFTEGANATVDNPALNDSNMGLFIRNADTFDSNTTLFVEKGFNTAETTSLFLKSSSLSGVSTLYSSGIGVTPGVAPLIIKAPEVKTTNLFSRGYN